MGHISHQLSLDQDATQDKHGEVAIRNKWPSRFQPMFGAERSHFQLGGIKLPQIMDEMMAMQSVCQSAHAPGAHKASPT